MIPVAQSEALDPVSAQARRFRCDVRFQIFSVHFVFLHGSHAFRYRKSIYASRCPSYFIFQRFHIKGRIAKTTHEGKTRKCTGCDTSIQPGVH